MMIKYFLLRIIKRMAPVSICKVPLTNSAYRLRPGLETLNSLHVLTSNTQPFPGQTLTEHRTPTV